jgi:hypothetical protein
MHSRFAGATAGCIALVDRIRLDEAGDAAVAAGFKTLK